MVQKGRSAKARRKRKKVHVRPADGTCASHPGEPLFPSRGRLGAAVGCRVCSRKKPRKGNSVHHLRVAVKKLQGAMRYLAPRWQYRKDQEAGAYEAWYTMH